MQFKKFSAGVKSYGTSGDNTEAMRFHTTVPGGIPNVNFDDEAFFQDMNNDSQQGILIWKMLTNLALNHSVLVSTKNNEINYNASSPDELALVNGARFLGVTFELRDEDNNIFISINNQKTKF